MTSTRALGKSQTHDIFYGSRCKLTKFSTLPFNQSVFVSSSPFDLIHYTVWGPSPIPTKGGSQYYVSFIDDHTCYCWVYLIKQRSELFEVCNVFRTLVKIQHSIVIKCFRCDLGGELIYNKFPELLAADGTLQQTLCTDTSEQNGVAERLYRYIVETAKSLLLSASIPSELWVKLFLLL